MKIHRNTRNEDEDTEGREKIDIQDRERVRSYRTVVRRSRISRIQISVTTRNSHLSRHGKRSSAVED
jgi:hypothetical protein